VSGDALKRADEHLRKQPGISRTRGNSGTGSLVVHYDTKTQTREAVLSMLRDAGIVATATARVLGEDVPSGGPSSTSENMIAAINDLDARISRLTGHTVDLKLLFPLGLAAAGLRQLFTVGFGLAKVPAYVLLWYAFDAFWRFHRERPKHEYR
jgi:hypothetical protein